MLTCSKTYRDIPFAHRQHRHGGHCSLVHGHNWTIIISFACKETDDNGFVVDFGDLKYLKDWIAHNLDHACLFNESDPESEALLVQSGHLFKPYILPNASCEGLAQHLHEVFNLMVREQSKDRVWVTQVEVKEDSKNSSIFSLD